MSTWQKNEQKQANNQKHWARGYLKGCDDTREEQDKMLNEYYAKHLSFKRDISIALRCFIAGIITGITIALCAWLVACATGSKIEKSYGKAKTNKTAQTSANQGGVYCGASLFLPSVSGRLSPDFGNAVVENSLGEGRLRLVMHSNFSRKQV